MIVAPGSTDVMVDVQIVDDDGQPLLGLVAATFPSLSFSTGTNVAAVSITLSDLALITTAHTDGGVKERSAGFYRLDLPDAAVASLGTTKLIGDSAGKHVLHEPISVVNISSPGSGARVVTVTVNDGALPTPAVLENAKVRFSEGGNTYVVSTNASGVATFALDDATYSLAISKVGYSFTPTTQVVDGNETVTKSMTAISITAPSSPDVSVGVLNSYDAQGAIEPNVAFTFQMNRGPGTDGRSFGSEFPASSNGSGRLEEEFVRGATYEGWRGDGDHVEFLVPDEDNFVLPETLQRP